MKQLIRYFFAFFFLFSITDSFAQNVSSQAMNQAKTLLSSRGLNEGEVFAKFKSRGLDVENMNESDFLKNQGVLEQIIAEIEAENKVKKYSLENVSNKPAESVLKSIIDSSTDSVKMVSTHLAAKQVNPVSLTAPSDIYGHKIFRDNSLEIYRTSKDASPPDSYILAAGDKINIVIFGKSQADLQYEINSAGFIQPTNMPKIFLSGLTLKQAKNLVALRFSTFYFFNKDQFALTLNTSRTLNVNIFGEVEKAGSFTTSALNTALNVLSASGGPTNFGTVRNIQIIRGSVKKLLDVYAFMRNPILQFDFYLQNNDIIYIAPAQKVVSLNGAVNRPMRYELKGKEGITELLDFAGGIKSDALTDFIQLQRYENNVAVIKDYPLKDILSGKLKLELLNGDVITIKSINSELKTIVKVSGAVDYPGNYELGSTKTVKELLVKAKLKPEAKTDQAFIFRKRLDQTSGIIAINITEVLKGKLNYALEKEDSLVIFDQARYIDQFSIAVVGEVRNPFDRNFRYDESLTIQEAIDLAGGLKNTALASGYIYRTNPFNLKRTVYIPVNLMDKSSPKLNPGDKLVILNKDVYEIDATINLVGEVKSPVSIRFDSTISVKDLIKLAGGFTIAADLTNVNIFRLKFSKDKAPIKELIKFSIDQNFNILGDDTILKLQPYDLVVVRKIPEFQLNEQVEIKGEVNFPGFYILKSRQEYFTDVIRDASGFTNYADLSNITIIRYQNNDGRLIFDAESAMRNKHNGKFDPIMLPGDYIQVPFTINTIKIELAGTRFLLQGNQAEINVNFSGARKANWYINNFAGGFSEEADRSSVRVIRGNGAIVSTKKWLGLINVYPRVNSGDKILLSYKVEKTKNQNEKPFDWEKFMNKILAVATSVALITLYTK
ncbi:SLBB domain-containing protein [Aquirufa sp. 2-AUSEE-184A6]|uniref:SLBB domain-containing protein n=1 Tax=Aquirufa novilacunae TaxID=3139305 RepID=A0ABW8SWJ3_9BACT